MKFVYVAAIAIAIALGGVLLYSPQNTVESNATEEPADLESCQTEVRDIANKTRNAGYPHVMSIHFLNSDSPTYEECLTVWRSGQSMWIDISSKLRDG